jgi:hypothetical protein
MSFSNLKKNRGRNIDKLVQEAEKINTGGGGGNKYVDERIWKPTVDKSGNGYAVIRFLPAPDGEELPWVRYWDHGFKGPTGLWYIEKSLTTIGQNDPVSEANSRLWNSGRDEDKQTARDRKRRLHYVSNIYVVKDPSNPENEGKVFLYQYGKKIFDKIMDMMQPQFQDEEPVDPFDFWDGADFKLKIRQVEGYRNYDKSEFAAPSALLGGDDEELEGVYNRMYSLKEYVDPKNFKSYEELKAKLHRVLGEGSEETLSTAESISLDETSSGPSFKSSEASTESSAPSEPMSSNDDDDDDDDTLSYFAKLAAQD